MKKVKKVAKEPQFVKVKKELLATLLIADNMAIRQFQSKTGVTGRTLYNWLGKDNLVSRKKLKKVADYLNIPVEELIAKE